MMFAAGGMIWANAVPKQTKSYVDPITNKTLTTKIYGWPIWTMIQWEGYSNNPEQGSFLVSGIINGIPCVMLLYILAGILERRIQNDNKSGE